MIGEGFNGQAFISSAHPDVLLKLIRTEMGTAEKVEQEFYAARAAFDMGIPTPEMYEIVRDGKDHGYLCQFIKGKKSIARLCADTPQRIPEYAAIMAEYGHQLHRMPITLSDYVVSMRQLLLTALETSPLVNEAQRERLQILAEGMPETGTCLHGDFQVGNLILTDSRYYWIDMAWLAQGWYLMDLAHLYKMMVEDSVIPGVQDLTHMSREQMLTFWDLFAKAYTDTDDVEAFNHELRPYAALDMVRTYYLHPIDDPQLLAFCRHRIEEDLC